MGMNAFVCMLGNIRKSAGGLRLPWISQNLQVWKKGRKQTSSSWCWCTLNPCPLLKPQEPSPLLPFPHALLLWGRKSNTSLMMLRGGCATALLQCQTSACRQTTSRQKSQLQENYPGQGRGQAICSSQPKHMKQFVFIAGHTKAAALKHRTWKEDHTCNILAFLTHLYLTMITMQLRFLSVG